MEPESSARVLAKRLGALSDVETRVTYLRHELAHMGATQAAQLVACVFSGAQAREPELADLLQWVSLALSDPSCKPLRDAVSAWLLHHDTTPLATSFQDPPSPTQDGDESGSGTADPSASRQSRRERVLTLGERKALARRQDRGLVQRALRDPHPDVTAILLKNPILTEPDVVRLCATRQVPPEVLRQVFRSARWVVRYPVKVALVLNPDTPLDMSLQLSPLLKRQDQLRVLSAGQRVAPALAEACRHMIERATLH